MATSSAAPRWLIDVALRVAAGEGESRPWGAEFVETTRGGAIAAMRGGLIRRSDESVYLVVLRGHFTHNRYPPGASPPRGSVLTFTADRKTQDIYDLGIGDQVPDLSLLGRAHSFSLTESES